MLATSQLLFAKLTSCKDDGVSKAYRPTKKHLSRIPAQTEIVLVLCMINNTIHHRK